MRITIDVPDDEVDLLRAALRAVFEDSVSWEDLKLDAKVHRNENRRVEFGNIIEAGETFYNRVMAKLG